MGKIWKNVFNNIKREKMISLSNIFVMTITFTLLGVFISMIVGSQTAIKYLERQAQLTVFFKDDYVEQNIINMQTELEKDPRISSVKYVSKEDAFMIFKEVNKDEPMLLESISASILPASLEIRTNEIKDLSVLATELNTREGVEEVKFFQDVIERFRTFTRTIYVVGAILVFVFLLISYSVILTTLRATINSKGVELEIFKLVGATNSYVKKPLIYQGVLFGFISATIASILISGILLGFVAPPQDMFYLGFYMYFGPSFIVKPYIFSIILSSLLIISGVLLGYLGSNSAVKKYLKY